MSNFTIRRADRRDIEAYFDDLSDHVEEADIALAGDEVVGMGGFSRKHGRLWVFLNVEPSARRFGFRIARALMRRLRARNETVFIQCDGDYAARFLKLLGFKPTDEMITDMRDGTTNLRIWQWRNSQL
jgi:hypothetical protein